MRESEPKLDRREFLTGFARRALRAEVFRCWHCVATGLGDLGVLWGAWGINPNDVHVVGDDGAIVHWDGQVWARQPSVTRLPLHAVWGPSTAEIFAVGWMGVICHRRDGVWRLVQGGEVDPRSGGYSNRPQNQPLFALWGRARDDVWAVGDHGRVVHYDGELWQEQESGLATHLRCVAGLPDDGLLVGGLQGLLTHYDGRHWSSVALSTKANITRIWVRSSDDIYAVGGDYEAAGNRFVGRAFHFDGASWRTLESAAPLERLRAVEGNDAFVLAAGDRGSLYRLDGERIERMESAATHDLYDLVLVEDRAFAVGDFGTILAPAPSAPGHQDQVQPQKHPPSTSRWEHIDHGRTDRVLWAVWGYDERNVFAAGEGGTILHYDGDAWIAMDTPTRFHLHGLWGTTPRNVYAVGQQGLILHHDGESWTEVHRLGVDVTAVAVTGFGPHEIFVVGDEGLVLRFDGAEWRRCPVATKNALYAVWGVDARHLLAAGDFGTVLRFNGERFDEFNAGTESFLYGVWGDALDNVHVVGQSGCAHRFDGRRWLQQATRQRCDILAVTGRPGHAPLAVGTLGTALRYSESRWIEESTDCESGLRALWMADDGTTFAVGDAGTILQRK